ncbi:hypothetical protein SRHO_G00050250 [Serrasalmus rhombeus]
MTQEHMLLYPPSIPTACGCWGGGCWPSLTLCSSEDKLLETWRQQESLRQLRREIEREKELKERKQKREKKEKKRMRLEKRRQQERERQKELEMVQWRLQILMERERVKEEDMQELQRLRKLEKELQLKELGEREKERKETERQPSTRKALRGSARDGEIRGMEEIIREKEMEILRCRDRINQLKREKVKEKHEKSIEKSFMRERNYGFRLLKTSQGIMTLAQYEQAKRESLQKKENRRLALETRMRDCNSIELNTSSSSNSADIYISSWNNTPKRKRSGSHTVWSLAKDPEKF